MHGPIKNGSLKFMYSIRSASVLYRTILCVYQLMGVFCERLKFDSEIALDCHTGQNKGRYHEKELLLLLVSMG